MRGERLTVRAVAALFLERQHLTRPRERTLTPARLTRFVEDVGGVQLDSINVVDRAHYLTLWSRFGPYDRERLDRLVYERRLLFEYWAHAACLVPISTLAHWRRAMLDYRVRHTGWSGWLRSHSRTLKAVRAAVEANGPMANGAFAGRRRAAEAAGWWNWKPTQHALHYLWMTGALTIHSRRHFQKRFDLLERALGEAGAVEAVSAAEFLRWHLERSLHAMGAATETDLSRYLTFPRLPPAVRREALRALVATGEVVEVRVEGRAERWLALARDVPALAGADPSRARGTTLLSPFDSLLWHRERVARLFGFDYRIEVYTPQAQRVHGYYTLPILHDGHLIGRVDAKADRTARRLEVRHVHFEPWVRQSARPPTGGERIDPDAALAGLAGALHSLGVFVNAEAVLLRRVSPHRLRGPLGRCLRGVASAS
jgi:uncharacterized protein